MDAGLPIDYDHATDLGAPEGRPAPAAGWICALEDRGGALWGKVEWTAHGADAVGTREYRYISPVFEYADNGEVSRLLRAALTNNPNLYLTAISARETQSEKAMKRVPHHGRGTEHMQTFDDELRTLLGLPAESSIETILEKIKELVSAAGNGPSQTEDEREQDLALNSGADPARFVPIARFEGALTELNQERAARRREQAEQAVASAIRDARLSPSQRDWAIAYCQADANGFAKFIANQSPLLAIAERAEDAFTQGKRDARPAANGTDRRIAERLSATETAICSKLGLKPSEYIRRKASAGDFPAFN
jgi:phage I-like protein